MGDIKTYGKASIPDIFDRLSNIILVIYRRKNGNVVVYEAKVRNGELQGIDAYWLDLDPNYRTPGKPLRQPFERLDHLAYGFKVIRKVSPKRWVLKFKQHPKEMVVVVSSCGKRVALFCDIKDSLTRVEHFFVADKTVLNMLPTVDYIEVVGFNTKTKKRVTERLVKNALGM
jgi:hypothetical protein